MNTPKWFLLNEGDKMLNSDEWYNPEKDAWEEISDVVSQDDIWFDILHYPTRRLNPDYVSQD